ncbi:ethanolamine ammonia-lyase small subunit [Marinomonas ushuaiensis DSM 15871]|uniref:Ethanolamine ammonia-lyase small subunit n=1 Tax=Marinomonas ushuaiensis DSM 15871 TaxID=1122207 RepID=X7EB65_9GAMM|nr:ethanolamine ammonia-lyase subunit EutC [Marinomonas ushuaiensis]ETX12421.1 ethanolamine ammonia-lyase small subunit [Marinomonas ushuaiensis DSM 15871]
MSQDKDLFIDSDNLDSIEEAVTENPWRKLNTFTDARVGLGRSGISVPTSHLLAFQLAHAQAIDAVHTQLNTNQLIKTLMEQNWIKEWTPDCAPLILHSRAADRATYLQRPDYGRLLDEASATKLDAHRASSNDTYDLAIVVVDGLSSLAIEQNTLPFLGALFSQIKTHQKDDWKIAPICIVEQGRVAIGDDVCQRLNAKCVLVLIGERPGLSSPDSLGLYLTWDGKVGFTDAYRNCISNIRPAGLVYQEAARKAYYLLNEARTLKLSGVKLKDRSDDDLIKNTTEKSQNFLIN